METAGSALERDTRGCGLPDGLATNKRKNGPVQWFRPEKGGDAHFLH